MIRYFLTKGKPFLFLSLTCIFLSCNKNEDPKIDPEPNPTSYEYMSVTRNGVDNASLKSISLILGGTATEVGVFQNNVKFLKLQGDHPNFQINLRIPEFFWEEGTYTLEEGTGSLNQNCFVTLIENSNFDFDIEGEITITTFDLTNRILEGTFNFSSPTNTVTGTLDYPLDDPEFD